MKVPSDKNLNDDFNIRILNVNNPKSVERDIYTSSSSIEIYFYSNFAEF